MDWTPSTIESSGSNHNASCAFSYTDLNELCYTNPPPYVFRNLHSVSSNVGVFSFEYSPPCLYPSSSLSYSVDRTGGGVLA